jgi:hypothetical protein
MPITEGGRFSPVDTIVSPGVFTRENDLSGLAQGVANIGGAVVAPFARGPAFTPTLVTDVNELESKFGLADGVYYGPYTAKQYLQEQGRVTVCRVGGLTGYYQKNPYMIYAYPGTWTRANWQLFIDTGSLSSYIESSVGNTDPFDVLTYTSASGITSSLAVAGTLFATFTSITASNLPAGSGSAYAGQTFDVGTFTITLSGSQFYLTSSIQGDGAQSQEQKLLQAIVESQTNMSFLSGSYTGKIPIVASSTFGGSDIYLVNPSFAVFRAAGGCGSVLYLVSGSVSGSFGDYTGTFAWSGGLNSDPCATPTDSGSVQILAVLANTQYVSQDSTDLSLAGFSGSTLTQVLAAGYTAADVVNGKKFNLLLKDGISNTTFGTYEFSLNRTDNEYITSVFGNDATAGNPALFVRGQKIEAAYLYSIFQDTIDKVVAEPWNWLIAGGVSIVPQSGSTTQARIGDLLNFTDANSLNISAGDSAFSITNAYTPWINSQGIANWAGSTGGTAKTRFPLFRVNTLGDGTVENKRVKIEISNVKLAGTVPGSEFGSFTLSVRDYNDTDKRPKTFEIFQNLNLDPNSANFIARRIGDRFNYITFAGKIIEFGTYANLSRYIRIEMTENVYPDTAVPYGFAAYATPIDSNYGKFIPKMLYSKASTYSSQPGKYPSGLVFGDPPVGADQVLLDLYPETTTGVGVDIDTKQYFNSLPAFGANISVGANVPFDLEDDLTEGGVTAGNSVPSIYDVANETTYVKMRKFVLGFQGGFDGQWPGIPINVGSDIIAGNTQGLDCTGITSAGSIAYKQCIAALGNSEEWDINLVVLPGIFSSLHIYVANQVVEMCEDRGDCFYIMDNVVFPASNQSTGMIDAAVAEAEKFDTSYAATYYPWVRILDVNTNKIVSVPPSVVMPGVYAANDRASAEWFAPAGLNRGGITQAIQVLDRTTHADRDVLYEGRVNPIAAFPGQGICAWGQKTLQVKASALDRVNVRRLLIALKKYIASTSRYLVFEQNVAATRNSFLGIVNPYLESVQQRSGLYAFQVVMDDTNNTPDIIDRNILYGQIYLQPAKTAEFIVLDFNVMPTGATFANL